METTTPMKQAAGDIGTMLPGKKITKERIQELNGILETYKAAKSHLDSRIVAAEQYWKLRHWDMIRPEKIGDPEPASGWLVNTILAKHSDATDAYPEAVCLAREEGDKGEAQMLTSILPVILQQNEFEQTWSDVWWYKLKSGTGVYGVFWDPKKLNGLGDIEIRKVDILNLFWEPGIDDIQKSRYLFCVSIQDNEALEEAYPQLQGKLDGSGDAVVKRYIYDDSISTQGKSAVIDCYYKRAGALHMVKYVGQEVLAATEDDPEMAGGLYGHGMYPFVFDPLFPEEGYPKCGFGYVDLCKEPQKAIDLLNNAFLQSAVASSTPRWFVRADGGVNEEEYADMTKKFVHVTGRMDEDSVRQILTQQMPGNAVEYMQMKINEMKEVSGNRDVNNGGTSASVTAASAIAALQEAGNGISRDMISASYRAFRKVVNLCIELIRQFYTLPRQFRIVGQYGMEQYVSYSNQGLQMQPIEMGFGQADGMRLPVFDIEVEVQSESSYTKEGYNQLAIQLYQLGIFDPNAAVPAGMMLEMMDFKGKNELLRKIQANGMLQQQLQMWQQMAVASMAQLDPQKAQGLAQAAGMQQQIPQGAGADPKEAAEATNGNRQGQTEGENTRVKNARKNAQEGAMPR